MLQTFRKIWNVQANQKRPSKDFFEIDLQKWYTVFQRIMKDARMQKNCKCARPLAALVTI